ncbi:MAG: DNA polymerase III subunit gamma/tau [Bacteroidota bacterium]
MENFIVSARKYRPQTFDTVIGQLHITTTLKNAIRNNHIAQAYLFCGPHGVGKTTCARILAKTINCFNRIKTIEACDECESCKSFNSGHSLNIYELDAASNNSVEDIRNLINQVSFAPQIGSHKVYIIDEIHMLSQNAFNAFLKTLEEPPHHAIFILATTEKHKIIPTILSRCQIFDFNKIKIDDIVSHLVEIAKKEKINAEEEALHIIAQKVNGSMRDALSILDRMVCLSGDDITYKTIIENLSILDYDYYFKITDAALNSNTSACLILFNEILNKGFDGHNFIDGFAEHLRNLLVCQDAITLPLMEVGVSIRERYKEQTKKTLPAFLLRSLEILNKADSQYKTSRNQRLLIELTLLQLCSLQSSSVQSTEKKEEIILKHENQSVKSYSPTPQSKIVTEPTIIPEKEIPPLTPSIEKVSPLKNIPTIGGIIKQNTEKKHSSSEEPNKDQRPKNQNSHFSEDELKKKWIDFAQQIKTKNKLNLFSTLTSYLPVLTENFVIDFTVQNQVQEDEINSIKADLLGFLRNQLSNYQIQLNILVKKNETAKRPYTAQEKFDYLAEKNPTINNLRQQFNLEIDF